MTDSRSVRRVTFRWPLIVLGTVSCLLLSSVAAQHIETRVELPDTLAGLEYPLCLVDATGAGRVYVAGLGNSLVVIDAATSRRVASLPMTDWEVRRLSYNYRDHKVYAPGTRNRDVTVIDAATIRVKTSVSLGASPSDICYDGDGNKVFVACPQRGLLVIDGANDSLRLHVPGISAVATLCLHPGLGKLYCASYAESVLTVVDIHGDSVIARIPLPSYSDALCLNPTLGKLYCAVYPNQVAVIDCRGDSLLRLLATPARRIACDSTRGLVYCAGSESVATIDCACDSVIATVRIGGQVEAMYCLPAAGRVYCGLVMCNRVIVLDAATGLIQDTIYTGRWPTAFLARGPDTLYCLGQHSSDVSLINTADGRVLDNILVGFVTADLCSNPAESKLYVGANNSASLVVVDGATNQVRGEVKLGGHRWAEPRLPGLCLNSVHNKLYCRLHDSIAVIDCRTDSVVSYVDLSALEGGSALLEFNVRADKFYACGQESLAVFSGADEHRLSALPVHNLGIDDRAGLCFDPLRNRLYDTGSESLAVISGATDSVLAMVFVGHVAGPTPSLFCVSASGRVYLLGEDCVAVLDSDYIVRVIPAQTLECRVPAACGNPDAGKVYVGEYDSLLFLAADDDSVRNRVYVGGEMGGDVSGLYYSPVSRLLYCASDAWTSRDTVYVFDGQNDSVVKKFGGFNGPFGLVPNLVHDRIYVANHHDGTLTILRDSLPAGQARDGGAPVTGPGATVVRGKLHLPADSKPDGCERVPMTTLLDASGRRVLALHPGTNDVRSLARGVYFVVTHSLPSTAARKVILE